MTIFLKIFEKSWFWSKILNSRFYLKFTKSMDFGPMFRKSRFLSNFENLPNGHNLQKSRLWYKYSKMLGTNIWKYWYFRKIWLSANISKSWICQIFRNSIYFWHVSIIPNLVTIMVNLNFLVKIDKKITIFLKFYEKYQICSKFPEKFRLWRFFFNLDDCKNFRNCWF